MLRRPDGIYTAEPMFINPEVVKAIEVLGVTVAFTMSSEVVSHVLQQTPPLQMEVPLDPHGTAILPLVASVEDIGSGKATIKRDSYMCLCRNERFLLVWGHTVPGIVAHGSDIEAKLFGILLSEVRYDGDYMRFALLATVPLFASFSLFFMIVITGSIFQLFGPLSGVQGNSMFYSAKAPKLGRHADYELPHVTIQMPVYKEGLKGVIIPTVETLLRAVKHYEEHGGTASIYVNDDGMRLVKEDLQEARKAFYELNNIGWCARPKHNENPDTEKGEIHFVRKGQFKKASNMNYCLDFSLRVEDELQRMIDVVCAERGCTQDDLSVEEEATIYEKARGAMVEKDQGNTWAAGNVRLGEIILIIDSDTRVPEDCLLYGALEMHESPEVALLQHASGILQVVHNVFENGITYFTNLIYTSITFAVGNGDCAPFVGHNTFIRWKAIQSISWHDEEDQMTKFWSDSHVSEDFDVSLRLQMNNFVVRLATYHDGGFKEGVSLTVYDELARWEKYAYGCNELVFNPLIRWPTRGPFTRLFLRFLSSNIKITSKITILAYIGTYYAIASAIPLTIANYLLVGWCGDSIDQFYLTSWQIFVGMAVVFNVLSPLGYAMLRHRLGQTTFFAALLETAKWTPMFLLFFGGISYHLAKAILCHFFSVRMEWTTTAKELTDSGFRAGLDRIVRDFKYMYAFCVVVAGGMVYLAVYAPRGWRIEDFAAIVPVANQIGCHALLPFALGLF
ncbi:glycosyltransferase family 2 protein [Neofusicoccum parvum]|uniref:Glycosyltransferase family 2 protein n=1 Tax=Neofusicoccum parvum TaxID=310453 RepID=A0ACB5S2T9_9PEZI|nr:glycosyltransferase family 2 protein [Neofusicoccum parvum]